MEREIGQLLVDACQIGVREGCRFGLFVLGISLVWRVARIPDLSSYAAFMLGGAIAGAIHSANLGTWMGYSLSVAAGIAVGSAVFLLWRKYGLNILVVGVVLSSMGFSAAAVVMGFRATLQTTELLSQVQAGSWEAPIRHAAVMLGALLLLGVFFQSAWGSNLFTWCRSEPLSSPSRGRTLRSPDLQALILGSICVAISGFMQARDHGEFSLNEGKDLLFKALVMIVLGEALVVAIRLSARRITRRLSTWLHKRAAFTAPLLILVAGPIGATIYWMLVNVGDEILRRFTQATGTGGDWSGLSQGMVAVLAMCCLLAARAAVRREDIYEAWRFRG